MKSRRNILARLLVNVVATFRIKRWDRFVLGIIRRQKKEMKYHGKVFIRQTAKV